jgi:hypothetical protein
MQQESLNRKLQEIYSPQYSEDIPSAFLEDLEKKLDQQQAKRKSGLLWWSGGALGLLMTFFSVWYFYPKTSAGLNREVVAKTSGENGQEIKKNNKLNQI